MKYKLFVSEDAGLNYNLVGEENNIKKLTQKAKEFDKELLRWTIEDENGEIIKYGSVLQSHVNAIKLLGKGARR